VSDLRRGSVSLFLLALAVLLLEVAFTRIFSVMFWHHFVYLIVSLALLGFGAASTFLTVSPRFSSEGINSRLLARYALAFCLSTVLGFGAATKVRFQPMDIFRGDLSNIFSMLMLYVIIGVPFFFAGVCIGYLISRAGEAVNRLYFWDLLGAGVGALLSVVCINKLGAEGTIYVAGVAGGLVASSYARAGGGRALRLAAPASVALALLMVLVAARGQVFPVSFQPEKEIYARAKESHYYSWHVVGRVDVLSPSPRLSAFGGAISQACDPKFLEIPIRCIFQDGSAPTGIVSVPNGDVAKVPALGYYLQSAPYVIKPEPKRALVIGVGGGIDVLIALFHGARHVVGVELNPATVLAVKDFYADFAGRIFDRPEVELIAAEGRHYVTATSDRFDVIQLSGVDSFAALSSGAYALSEGYLYTVEAVQDYWRRLRGGGVLSFSRLLYEPPRESLRLVSVMIEALRRLGVDNPERHLIVTSGHTEGTGWAETLLKKGEFTEPDAAACRDWAERMRFEVLYDPFRPRDNPFDQLIRSSPQRRAVMIEEYPYNISPISDDDPFFFNYSRWRSLFRGARGESTEGSEFPLGLVVLLLSLVQILILGAALIVGPLLPRVTQLRRVRHKGRLLIYFGALGLGFITVEIALLQKYTVFVGGPVYAMAVTLFAILVFSGLGSLVAKSVSGLVRRALTVILLVLVGAILAESVFVNFAVPRLMFLSHALRCLVTVLAIAPLALLMGMPFPTGLRVAQRLGQAIVPWTWGVNAVMTTLGSMLCVLVSMNLGFTAGLYGAALTYLVALLVGLDEVPIGERSTGG
jgi:SAM-dependent methyltransferase